MKKRLISMLLVVVMLVAMIPATAMTATAAASTKYVTNVTTDNVIVDGELDDAYEYSQKIIPVKWHTGDKTKAYFEAYTVLTLNGLYVWAEIKDSSLDKAASTAVNNGDKFQIYISLDNGSESTWGWYESDYNGKTYVSTQGGVGLTAATVVTKKLEDGSGWRSETFIPYGNVDPLNISNLKIAIGLQVNNEVDSNNRTGLCYDHAEGGSFWSTKDNYTPLSASVPGNVYKAGTREKTAVYVTTAPTMDGRKDANVYSEHAKTTLRNIVTGSGFANDTRNEMGDVYLAFDNNNVYIYYEVYDKDLTANDYFQTYYKFNNGGTYRSGYFCTKLDSTQSAFYGSTGANYGYPGTAYTASDVSVARASLGNDRYSIEIRLPIPTGDKNTLASTGKLDFNLAFSSNDYANYTVEYEAGKTNSRRAYGGCEAISASLYSYSTAYPRFPVVTLNKAYTDATPGVIEGASLSLGSDISVNYYALVGANDVEKAYMKFTVGSKEYIAYPKASTYVANYPRECMFTCEGMAPQTMGDNIKAELYIGDKLVATHDNYSILQNCLNIYNSAAYKAESYNNMKWLVLALMNYGAAAQDYAGYKTSDLVNDGYEIDLLDPDAAQNIRTIGTAISDTVKMTALGVFFDTANKVYVKFTAPSISGITVTIDGNPAAISKVAGEENVYIAYSNDISVLEFDAEQRIVLSDGSKSQVALYSVNSYAYAKKDSDYSKMAELAKATYTYGEYARDYANMGVGSYSVMTINDGDGSYHKIGNYNYVAKIINYYAPDLVGMQEVQKADASGSNSNYAKLLGSNYGIIYYKHGFPYKYSSYIPDTSWPNAASEAANEYGNVILYRKDKFDLIDKGQQWLSNTPDKASRIEGSDYTRSYVWAKLRDKKTGEEFVFVSTHIDYVASVNKAQIQILLDLTAAKFPDLPIVYTADWNCGEGTEGYKAMNAAGYVATETLLTNPYKPASTIDFCFVDPDEFTSIGYKYINHHDFGEDVDFYTQVSDHPLILTEIAPVKVTEQKPLPDFSEPAPDPAPEEDVIKGGFNSEDDTDLY